MAKLLASEASWAAADMCMQTHGGFGFAEEYDVERKFRETRLYQVAPISTNLILAYVAEHVLGLAAVLLRTPCVMAGLVPAISIGENSPMCGSSTFTSWLVDRGGALYVGVTSRTRFAASMNTETK